MILKLMEFLQIYWKECTEWVNRLNQRIVYMIALANKNQIKKSKKKSMEHNESIK